MRSVGSFSKPYEAHLLVSRLEASGIRAFLRDEYTVTLYWLYSNAIGGVKVDVADEDYERAMELLSLDAAGQGPQQVGTGHSFARYLMMFGIVFFAAFGIFLWMSRLTADISELQMPIVASFVLAAVVSGFCAVVDC
jgi:hypothetical protein